MSASKLPIHQAKTPDHQIKKVKNFMFNIYNEIGSGFSSKVYKGKDCNTGKNVAIKVIELKKLTNDIQKMLLSNQIKALSTLNHPNILHALHTMQTSNNFYIVTELFQQNLQNYLKTKGSFTEDEAMIFLIKMTNALSYLQTCGVVHRDVKPSNIFISSSGQYVLGDLGFCQFKESPSQFESGYNIGSPYYMSPEAYKNSQYGYKSDIWAFGICIIQVLCGKRPFSSITFDSMVKAVCENKFFKEFNISDRLKNIIQSMLQFSTQKRITPLDLYKKLSFMGIQMDPQPTPVILRNNTIKQIHKRSLSIGIQSQKQIGFRNMPKLKISTHITNQQNSAGLINLNSSRQIISQQPLTQRKIENIPNHYFVQMAHQIPNPKLVILQNLLNILVNDPNVCENLSKLKLLTILLSVNKLQKSASLTSRIQQVLSNDSYFQYVINTINDHHGLFAISHYLCFLFSQIVKEYNNQNQQLSQHELKFLYCTKQALSLWNDIHCKILKQNHANQASADSHEKTLDRNKSKSVGNLNPTFIFPNRVING